MNEQERKELKEYLSSLKTAYGEGVMDMKAAVDMLLEKAAKIKEMRGTEVGEKRGLSEYRSFVNETKASTVNAVADLIFDGGVNVASDICELSKKGMSKNEIYDAICETDTTGSIAMNREHYMNAIDCIIEAMEYDNAHVEDTRKFVAEGFKILEDPEPDMDVVGPMLEASGIQKAENPVGREKEIRGIISQRAMLDLDIKAYVPRWAIALLRRPGMTQAERQEVEANWNAGPEGRAKVYELFISEIEHVKPETLDVKNVDDYLKNFGEYDYIGGLTFELESFTSTCESDGFVISPERRADLNTINAVVTSIQNKFNLALNLAENPLFKYIKGFDELDVSKATNFMGLVQEYLKDKRVAFDKNAQPTKEQLQIEALSSFSVNSTVYATNDLPNPSRAKEILAYKKEYKGEERSRMLKAWYDQFKQTMAAEGFDLNDPVSMTRLKAKVPGKDGVLYMPAMKGLDEEFNKAGKPALPGIDWYKDNMLSANQLGEEQISQLYELSKKGQLAIYGKEMNEESMHVVYNDKGGKPQLSKPLIDVNSSGFFRDEETLAQEMFPDATYPFRVYQQACDVHKAHRNQVPIIKGEDGGDEPDSEEAVRVAYDRTLIRDYFENGQEYSNPEAAKDREAQIYTINKYSYGRDEEFNKEYEAYMEANNIDFDGKKIFTDQEKAIRSINDGKLNAVKIPEVTKEMEDFVNSIEPLLNQNGWNMENNVDKACLRMFADLGGKYKEIPTSAPLYFDVGKTTRIYKGVEDKLEEPSLSSEERYVLQNTGLVRCARGISKPDSRALSQEKLRVAMIYEYAKRGLLLVNKPGEPTSSAIPVVPGEDGKAKLVTNLAEFNDVERKSDIYINATRVRRLFNDPAEKAKMAYMEKNRNKIDFSINLGTATSLDQTLELACAQASVKNITSTADFVQQAMAKTPNITMTLSDYIGDRDLNLEDGVSFKPNQIKPKYMASRKELSRTARESFFSTRFETSSVNSAVAEAVKQGRITPDQAKGFETIRGLGVFFLDRGNDQGTIERNIKRVEILCGNDNQKKAELFNERLNMYSQFNADEFYDLSDADLVRRWPEIEKNMFPLQELITISKKMAEYGVNADPQLLEATLKVEEKSGDMYYGLSHRLQAIANPVYENTDMDQLINMDISTLNAIGGLEAVPGGKEYFRFINDIKTTRTGNNVAAATYIANQLGSKKGDVQFYNKTGNSITMFDLVDVLKKGEEVYAGKVGEDMVHPFKAAKGSFKAPAQPDAKYKKMIESLTGIRKFERRQKEKTNRQKEYAQFIKQAKANDKRIENIINARAQRKNAEAEYDGEGLSGMFDGYAPEEPQPAPPKPEKEVVRDQTQAFLKEEIEYQQYKLGLIIESYGPKGAFKEKTEDFKNLSKECVTEILALSKALERSGKDDITKADLQNLGSKKGVSAIKNSMMEEDGYKLTMEGLDTETLIQIAATDKQGPDKLESAKTVNNSYKANANLAKLRKEEAFKLQAREAMQKGIDKYKEFSKKLDDVIDYGQYKLGLAARDIQLNRKGVKDIAKSCLAEVFAAVTVKDIIDNKNMTYKQAEGLSSSKGLKTASKEIMDDPAFVQFFEGLTNIPEKLKKMVEVGRQNEDQSFNRKLIDDMLKGYNSLRKEMMKKKDVNQDPNQLDQPEMKKDNNLHI